MHVLLDNYTSVNVTEVHQKHKNLAKKGCESQQTLIVNILTYWLPVSIQVKTIISYIRSAVERGWGCSMPFH